MDTPLRLRTYPDPCLITPARKVTTHADWQVVKDAEREMRAICTQAKGYALAATQVGIDLAFWVCLPSKDLPSSAPQLVVNPTVPESHGSRWGSEGCLSLPGFRGSVRRAESLVLEYEMGPTYDEDRADRSLAATPRRHRYRCGGLLARLVAHEFEHCAGELFVEHLEGLSLAEAQRFLRAASLVAPVPADAAVLPRIVRGVSGSSNEAARICSRTP